ncbi:MAG TPA: hypothetical protein VE861_07690 [Gemmatimonadaceae bacterium]|nr:hypothetical protein [Gemmatimonadaceae bacterium]
MPHAAIALLLMATLTGCGGEEVERSGATVASAQLQSPSARAMRLPLMRPAPIVAARADMRAADISVRVRIEGRIPADTALQSGKYEPSCGATMIDHLVAQRGGALAGALVWIEGPTPIIAGAGVTEHRPTVAYQLCELLPRLQLASPGSTLQLVMRDERADSLVVVPAQPSLPIDTISFVTDGQLVPLRQRAESAGVLGIHATRLPWARAYIAISSPGAAMITDVDGRAEFRVDASGTATVVRAWHPSLGIVSATIDPSKGASEQVVTLTFKP